MHIGAEPDSGHVGRWVWQCFYTSTLMAPADCSLLPLLPMFAPMAPKAGGNKQYPGAARGQILLFVPEVLGSTAALGRAASGDVVWGVVSRCKGFN